MRSVRLEEEADAELTAAVRWYEDQRPGLGGDFYSAIQRAIDLVRKQTDAGSVPPRRGSRPVRWLMIHQFPYQVVFHVQADETVVLAFAHTSRHPGYWKHRT